MNQQEPMASAYPSPKASDLLFWQELGLPSLNEGTEERGAARPAADDEVSREMELMSGRVKKIILTTRLWWGMR